MGESKPPIKILRMNLNSALLKKRGFDGLEKRALALCFRPLCSDDSCGPYGQAPFPVCEICGLKYGIQVESPELRRLLFLTFS